MDPKTRLDARQFPDLKSAIRALYEAEDAELFIPAGIHTLTESLLIDHPNVCIQGKGPESVVRITHAEQPAVQVEAPGFTMSNVSIEGGSYSLLVGERATGLKVVNCALSPARA